MSSTLLNEIKKNRSRVFRRAYVKRRTSDTGLFESTWTEITRDVLKWGKISNSIDERQYNKFKFGGMNLKVANDSGRFNPENNPASLWFGFLSPQRSLVRIETGFVNESLGSDGIWRRSEFPFEISNQTSMSYLIDVSLPSSTTIFPAWRRAIAFTSPSFEGNLRGIRIPFTYVGSVGGYLTCDIYEGVSVTSNSPVAVATIPISELAPTNAGLSTGAGFLCDFDQPLTPNSTYWFVVNGNNVNATAGASVAWAFDTTTSSVDQYWSLNSGTSYSFVNNNGLGYDISITAGTTGAAFTGFISGDLPTSDKNVVDFKVQPLLDLFRQYPARLLDGFTSTGLTASQFVEMVRDHTDGAGQHVFLPFFGDTTTGFDIEATTEVYADLNTQTASDVIDSNIWSIIEKLAQAETLVPYVTRNGVFRFVNKQGATSSSYEFHGARSFDREYGRTIKKVDRYGIKFSKYYSRVDVQWNDNDADPTRIQTRETEFKVGPGNAPWIYGHKTYKLENNYIASSQVAEDVANIIFEDVAALKNEISFEASFVPQLDILDRIKITYDNAIYELGSLWDNNDWASDTVTTQTSAYFDTSGAGSSALNTLGNGYRISQSFLADTALAYMIEAKVPVWHVTQQTTAGFLTMEIRETGGANSTPSSTIIATATLAVTQIPKSQPDSIGAWVTFSFATSDEMSLGGQYHAILNPNDTNNGEQFRWMASALSAGSSAQWTHVSFNSGSSWNFSTSILMGDFVVGDAPTSLVDDYLIWDEQIGDALKIFDQEFKLLKIELNLDKLSTKIVAREI